MHVLELRVLCNTTNPLKLSPYGLLILQLFKMPVSSRIELCRIQNLDFSSIFALEQHLEDAVSHKEHADYLLIRVVESIEFQ